MTTRQKDQILAARVSIFGSVILFLVSAVIGIAVDSITLLLDASTSLAILATGFLMQFAIKKIHTPPDEAYNFGYHKYEPMTAMIQNILIIGMCIVSIKFAVQDLFHADDVHSYSLPAIATLLSGILGVFITVYMRMLAKRSDSQMLKTAGFHWLSDTVLSLGVSAGFFFGLIMQKAGYTSITPYIDPAMSILLALFFIFTPFRLGMRNFFELLDAVPHPDLHGKIKKAVNLCKPDLFSVHRLRIRKAGQKLFLEFCFSVHDNPTIKTVEELTGNFERDLKTHLPDCDVVVYFKSR